MSGYTTISRHYIMGVTMNIFKKTILTGATLLGSLFASQAYAQDRFNEDDKPAVVQKEEPKQEKKVDLKDDDSSVARKLDEMFRGSLEFRAETDPLVKTFAGNAQLEMKLGNFRPYIGIQDVFQNFDNIDGSELKVNSVREMLACGFYALNTKDLEVYLRAAVGREDSKFSDAIDMKAGRWLYGGEFGLASTKTGSLGLLKFYKGTGDFDAELNSGFEIDGDYDTTFVGFTGRQRLFSDGKRADGQAEFDKRQDERSADFSIDAIAELYWQRNEFGELETDNTYALKLGPAFTWNSRKEDGTGGIFTVTPYFTWKQTDTESGISLRETQTRTVGGGAQAVYSFNRYFSIGGSAGFTTNSQSIDDPGQGFDKTDKKNGFNGA